jgi:2-oxoglutarate dehydrogenase complex dehydrogenase (E1) component-like enzyme
VIILFLILAHMANARDVNVVVQRMMYRTYTSHAESRQIMVKRLMREAVDTLNQLNGNMETSLSQLQDGLMSVKYGIDMSQIDPEIKKASLDPRLRIRFEDCSELAKQCTIARYRAGIH